MLYHYSDARAIEGIAESGSFFATDSRFVNDQSELLEAGRLLFAAAESLGILGHVIAQGPFGALLAEAIKSAYELEVYAVSLSSHRDDLSQWRGYCPNAKGYALGIPAAVILEKMAAPWVLQPVCMSCRIDSRSCNG